MSFDYDELTKSIMQTVKTAPITLPDLVTATGGPQGEVEERVRHLLMKGVIRWHGSNLVAGLM